MHRAESFARTGVDVRADRNAGVLNWPTLFVEASRDLHGYHTRPSYSADSDLRAATEMSSLEYMVHGIHSTQRST